MTDPMTERYVEMARDHIRRALQQRTEAGARFYLRQAKAVLDGGLYDPAVDHRRIREFDVSAELERERLRLAGRPA